MGIETCDADLKGYSRSRLGSPREKIVIAVIPYWFRNRDKSGLIRSWPHFGTCETFVQSDLLLVVRTVLKKYERFLL